MFVLINNTSIAIIIWPILNDCTYMKICCCFLFAFCLLAQIAMGQQSPNPIQIKGDFGLYGDFYRMVSDTSGAVLPRRPAALVRLVVNASVSVNDFSMPISLTIPSGQYGMVVPERPSQPNAPLKNLMSLISDPSNRIGIAPKYKWAQLLLGSQIPQYSELSVGDVAVFGAGISLTPGKFRLSCFAGYSQQAIEEDTSKNIAGIYTRKIYSAKIGFGYEDSSHIYFVGSMMMDDTSSLQIRPVSVMPQSGVLSAIDYRINLSKKSYIKGEIAGSAFTRDMRSSDSPQFTPSLPSAIFTAKESSRMDFASILSVGTDYKNFGIKLVGRYYGDGFVPLGYPFLQTDRFEVTLDSRFILFKNKVQFSGSMGRRVNNLTEIRGATTTQTIGSANLNVLLSDNLSLAASYSNFGFRNSIINDTFRVEMVTNSYSISPSYNYSTQSSMHNFSLMFSQNIFNDFNVVSGALNNNDANNGTFSYLLSSLKTPFSFSSLLSYFDNISSYGKLITKSVNVGVGYKFFKNKLNTTAGITLTDSKIDASSSGFQLMTTLGAKYTLNKKFYFSVNGSLNMFKFGDVRPGISYHENLLRTAITYKL
jgi:hypothetical protein